MGVRRKWIDFNGNLYDIWHLVSVEAEDEYNDKRGDFDYLMVINKSAVSRDIKEVKINYRGEKDRRDADMVKWKENLKNDTGFRFVGEDDPHPNEDDGKTDDDYTVPQV